MGPDVTGCKSVSSIVHVLRCREVTGSTRVRTSDAAQEKSKLSEIPADSEVLPKKPRSVAVLEKSCNLGDWNDRARWRICTPDLCSPTPQHSTVFQNPFGLGH